MNYEKWDKITKEKKINHWKSISDEKFAARLLTRPWDALKYAPDRLNQNQLEWAVENASAFVLFNAESRLSHRQFIRASKIAPYAARPYLKKRLESVLATKWEYLSPQKIEECKKIIREMVK